MQTSTSLNSSKESRNAYVVRIGRPRTRNRSPRQRAVPSAAVHKAASKWTVVAAFILAVALHAGAVMWAEMDQVKLRLEAYVPAVIHPGEEFRTDARAVVGGATAEGIAAD